MKESSSNGFVSIGVTIATTIAVFIFSVTLGFIMGVGAYYILLKKSPTNKVENKTETEMRLRENTSERQILGSREAGQEVVYSDPETQEQNEDLSHSYCEVDDPINGTCVYTKPIASVSKEPIQLIPNKSRSYGESNKQRINNIHM